MSEIIISKSSEGIPYRILGEQVYIKSDWISGFHLESIYNMGKETSLEDLLLNEEFHQRLKQFKRGFYEDDETWYIREKILNLEDVTIEEIEDLSYEYSDKEFNMITFHKDDDSIAIVVKKGEFWDTLQPMYWNNKPILVFAKIPKGRGYQGYIWDKNSLEKIIKSGINFFIFSIEGEKGSRQFNLITDTEKDKEGTLEILVKNLSDLWKDKQVFALS